MDAHSRSATISGLDEIDSDLLYAYNIARFCISFGVAVEKLKTAQYSLCAANTVETACKLRYNFN